MIVIDFLPFDFVKFFDKSTNSYLEGYVIRIGLSEEFENFIMYNILDINSGKLYLKLCSDDVSLIERQIPFGYNKLCKSCSVFCKLPQACSDFCPARVRIKLPGQILSSNLYRDFKDIKLRCIYASKILSIVSSCFNPYFSSSRLEFSNLPEEYKEVNTIEKISYILRNQLTYDLHKEDLRFSVSGKYIGSVTFKKTDIDKIELSERNQGDNVHLSLSEIPCTYCVYQGSTVCDKCCFINFKLDERKNVYVDKRVD